MTVAVQDDFEKIILAIPSLDSHRHDLMILQVRAQQHVPSSRVYLARQSHLSDPPKQNKPRYQYKRHARKGKPTAEIDLSRSTPSIAPSPCMHYLPPPPNAAQRHNAPTPNSEASHPLYILTTEGRYLVPAKPLAMTAWISILVDGPSCGLQNFKSMNRPLTGGSNVMLHLFLSLSM